MRFLRSAGLLTLVCWGGTEALAQDKPQYMRVQCVKVVDGKSTEFDAILPDNRKLAKARVDNGRAVFSAVARAVYPSGRSAPCDYTFVEGYDGFPPEVSTEQSQADFKKSGISTTEADYRAKLLAAGYLVGQELWRSRGGVGAVAKGSYLKINFNNVKTGMNSEYLNWENSGWKQLAEVAAKEIPGTSWGLYTLTMPSGSGQPYNAMTVDGFPSWEALGKGLPVQDLWKKAHPDVDYTKHMQKMSTLLDRPLIHVYRVVDYLRK